MPNEWTEESWDDFEEHHWDEAARDFPVDDPGYRSCDCEDFPCCGHQKGGDIMKWSAEMLQCTLCTLPVMVLVATIIYLLT